MEARLTPETFKAIRKRAGLSTAGLAAHLRLADARTIRRYEDGSRPVSGPVSILVLALDRGLLTSEQLMELSEGKASK